MEAVGAAARERWVRRERKGVGRRERRVGLEQRARSKQRARRAKSAPRAATAALEGGGTAGAAGTTGGAGASGMSGAAGTASGAECTKADDCVLLSDCCACRAEPKGTVLPSCPAICTKDSCTANQIQPTEVTCVYGRCVIARSCNTARVTCLADPAECPPGTVHSVQDSCWGPCLPPTECRDVTDCSSCGAGVACVRHIQFSITTNCVAPAADCHAGNYCGCLVTCPDVCGETDAGVNCFCPGC